MQARVAGESIAVGLVQCGELKDVCCRGRRVVLLTPLLTLGRRGAMLAEQRVRSLGAEQCLTLSAALPSFAGSAARRAPPPVTTNLLPDEY